MKDLEKVATPMTVREYLNTLDSEDFTREMLDAFYYLRDSYYNTELDAFDVHEGIEMDMTCWLDSFYCKDKKLLSTLKLSFYGAETEHDDSDDLED